MRFEQPQFEKKAEPRIDAVPGYERFIPEEFKTDPLGYFETRGKNIKSGEPKYTLFGRLKDDPTAVKELPMWESAEGEILLTVGKRVNPEKGKVGESENPFYEYEVMEAVQGAGLPSPRPIAKVEQGDTRLIVMEKAKGIGWHDKEALEWEGNKCGVGDIEPLRAQAEQMMEKLKEQFESAGIVRGWKLKDMVFDVDVAQMKIRAITPTDWERTKIDKVKLQEYKRFK